MAWKQRIAGKMRTGAPAGKRRRRPSCFLLEQPAGALAISQLSIDGCATYTAASTRAAVQFALSKNCTVSEPHNAYDAWGSLPAEKGGFPLVVTQELGLAPGQEKTL